MSRKRRPALLAAAPLLLTATLLSPAQERPSRPGLGPGEDPARYRSTVTVLAETDDLVILRFDLTDVSSPGAGEASPGARPASAPTVAYRRIDPARTDSDAPWAARSGAPAEYSVLVAVPERGRIVSEVRAVAPDPPGSGPTGAWRAVVAVGHEPYVTVSEPAVLRDLRVVRVTFAPFASAANGAVRSLDVRIEATGDRGLNEIVAARHRPAAGFERLYEATVVNYPPRGPAGRPASPLPTGPGRRSADRVGAEYVVIADERFVDGLDDLIEWKEAKGLRCLVATTSETGTSAAEIRAYIQDAYQSWDVPPEYVLLAGDHTFVPVYYDGEVYTDNYYAAVAGDDYLADVMVGRFPAASVFECELMAAKAIAYESGGVDEDPVTGWPSSAALLVHDDPANSWVYYDNTWSIYALMEEAGFSPIDTLFTRNDVTTSEVLDAVNAGPGFVNFRGSAFCFWPPPFMIVPDELENGWRLPVMVSGTCETVSFEYDVCYSHTMLRAGTLAEPTGGVAFFGTSTIGNSLELSLERGYVDVGFFDHAFGWGRTIGEACAAGKLSLYLLADDRPEYEGWTLMGDPELNLWTGERMVLDVAFDPVIRVGPTELAVTVTSGGAPIGDARVDCRKDDVEAWALTDGDGEAVLAFETTSPGTLDVLVTARNAVPYHGQSLVIWSGPFVAPDTLALDDASGGNGDGLPSPGETVALDVRLTNLGNLPADGVEAVLRPLSGHTSSADSVAAYGDLDPGAASWGTRPYSVSISSDHPREEPVLLALRIAYGDSVRTAALPPINLAAGKLAMTRVVLGDAPPCGDGDGVADAGETVALSAFATNEGLCGLSAVRGSIVCDDPHLSIASGSASFTGAPPGSLASNPGDPFIVSVDPAATAGHEATLSIAFEAAGETYAYADTLDVVVTVGEASSASPAGPDWYGYYAYDSGDTLYDEAPEYEWIDIAPPGPGNLLTGISDYDDRVEILSPPFVFPYYGENYFTLTVCTNGFITVDMTNYSGGDNSPIPSHHGPPGMIAPFWDDLSPLAGGDVYFWPDQEEHRYVVQYERVRRAGSEATETFQVVLLDPAYHATPTGDGEIVFQYRDVNASDSCTVGIENAEQNDGIQYLFDGTYAASASPIRDSMAIRFTTRPPEGASLPWLVVSALRATDAAGDGDGRPEAGETIDIVIDLSNRGGAPADDVELSLTCADTAAVVQDGVSPFPGIAPGGSASNEDDPFTLTLAETAPDSLVALRFEVEGPAGQWNSALRYDLRVFAPDEPPVTTLRLAPCRPNPFVGSTVFHLELPQPGRVTLTVYDVAGRRVKTLRDGRETEPRLNVEWNGTDSAGHAVASGVYFVRMTCGGESRTRKAVLLR